MEPATILALMKVPERLLIALGISAAGILFLPSEWIAALRLSGLRDDSKGLLGLAVLLAIALVLVHAVILGTTWARRRATKRDEQRHAQAERHRLRKQGHDALIGFLEGMTNTERAICRPFIEMGERTMGLDVHDGNVRVLVERGVLEHSGLVTRIDRALTSRNQRSGTLVADYSMTDRAWNHLHSHRELLNFQETTG